MTSTTNPRPDGTPPHLDVDLAPQVGGARAASRLRILIGTDTYPPDVNGAAYHTVRLVAGLAARGHEVHVVCLSQGRYDATVRRDGVTEHLISWRTPLYPSLRVATPIGLRQITAAMIDEIELDLVHVQGHFPIGRALTRAATRGRVPLVATNHFNPDKVLGYTQLPAWAAKRLTRLAWGDATRVLERADIVTTPTLTALRLLYAHDPSAPAHVVSCGIDRRIFHPGDGDSGAARARFGLADRPTIGFVGRLDRHKHLDEAITALAAIREHNDAQLVIAGVGVGRAALEVQAITLGVAEHVHFLGFVPDPDLPEVYTAMDVFVTPGTAELQSIATREGLASGLPVVAADAVALPHLIAPGDNGYLDPPGDTDTLAACLRTLLGDPHLRTGWPTPHAPLPHTTISLSPSTRSRRSTGRSPHEPRHGPRPSTRGRHYRTAACWAAVIASNNQRPWISTGRVCRC